MKIFPQSSEQTQTDFYSITSKLKAMEVLSNGDGQDGKVGDLQAHLYRIVFQC